MLRWRIWRLPCALNPCRRCDRAGRTSWRSRELWHARRRDRWISVWVAVRAVACAVGALVLIMLAASYADGAW